MKNSERNKKEDKTIFPAIVVRIMNDYRLVINRGERDGIKLDQRFLIYNIDDEDIIDPETEENLGRLEIIRGTGKVIHLQEKVSTIESIKKLPSDRSVIKRRDLIKWFGTEEETIFHSGELEPFEDSRVGDKAKPI